MLSDEALNRRPTLQLQIDPANLAGLIDLIGTIPLPCSGVVSASHETATVADRRYTAKGILGHDPESTASDSSSAFLGDLCAFAVKISSSPMAIRGIDFDFGKEPADTFTRDQHPDLRADFVMALPSAAARSSVPAISRLDEVRGRVAFDSRFLETGIKLEIPKTSAPPSKKSP